jgi:hypothetical protein
MNSLRMLKTPAGILSVFAVGALGGGVAGAYVLAQPVHHAPRTSQVAQTAAPTADPTTVAAKPVKIAAPVLRQPAKRTTTTKARSLVNTQADPTPEPASTQAPPPPDRGDGPGPFDVSKPKPTKP